MVTKKQKQEHERIKLFLTILNRLKTAKRQRAFIKILKILGGVI